MRDPPYAQDIYALLRERGPRRSLTHPHASPLREGDWFRTAVFYEIPVRSFFDSNGDGVGDLAGVTAKLDYLAGLGVGAIWLLPFYRSAWRDEGYDITDHYSVDPSLGTLADLDALLAEAHARRIRVLGDLVTNHISIDHPWFQEARRDRASPHRSWFLWSDTGKEFSRTRVIFRDLEPANWTWDEVAGQYYFHRFYATQPDLNYDTPAVREEMVKVARFWLDRGLDGFRCDAVPYLFKREGTRCQSLPEVHGFFRELRAMIDAEFPRAILVAEANQSIPETVPYFGEGREFQMVMHFPLMPNLFLAFSEGDPRRVLHVLRATLPTPKGCGWAYFLRNHDEVTLEQVSDDEREMMVWVYGQDARTVINGGLRRRLAPMLGGSDDATEMMFALALSLPGAMFLYYGDEIGMGDRLDLPDRDGVRTPMQWARGVTAGFSTAPPDRWVRPVVTDPLYGPERRNVADQVGRPDSLYSRTRHLNHVYAAHPTEFGPDSFVPAEPGTPRVLAFWRHGPARRILCLYNLSQEVVEGAVATDPSVDPAPETLAGDARLAPRSGSLGFSLGPHRFAWLAFATGAGGRP